MRPDLVEVRPDRNALVSVPFLSAHCVRAIVTNDLILIHKYESQPLRDLTNQPPRPKKFKGGSGFV